MTRFRKIKLEAKRQGIVVERVGGKYPYEVYREDDHGSVGICKNLWEVEQDIQAFATPVPPRVCSSR